MNTNLKMVNRDIGLDVIKAFATILVISGHVTQSTNVIFDKSIVFKIIYSFHMPLFMFISGYLTPKTLSEGFLTSKFKQLVVPFLLWSVILIIFNNFEAIKIGGAYVLLEGLWQIVLNPDNGGLWFLWVLFLNFLVFSLIDEKYRLILSAIIIFALTILQSLDRNFALFGLGLFRWHYFFFLFGFLAGNHEILDKIKIKPLVIFSITVLFITQWDRNSITSFFGFSVTNSGVASLLTLIVKYICAIGAIIFIFSMKGKIRIFGWWINILSTESLGYYALQGVFIFTFITILSAEALNSNLLYQLSVFFLTLFSCTLSIIFLKKYYYLNKYLLGKLDRKHISVKTD